MYALICYGCPLLWWLTALGNPPFPWLPLTQVCNCTWSHSFRMCSVSPSFFPPPPPPLSLSLSLFMHKHTCTLTHSSPLSFLFFLTLTRLYSSHMPILTSKPNRCEYLRFYCVQREIDPFFFSTTWYPSFVSIPQFHWTVATLAGLLQHPVGIYFIPCKCILIPAFITLYSILLARTALVTKSCLFYVQFQPSVLPTFSHALLHWTNLHIASKYATSTGFSLMYMYTCIGDGVGGKSFDYPLGI